MTDEMASSSNAGNEISADPPLPPNWNANLEDTILSLAPYKLFPIDPDTLEYATIAALLNPFEISAVEQIVNPTLWSRFVNTRKEMLLSKSDDFRLLSKLLLDEKKIMQHMHVAFGFDKHAQVAACPYDENVALLFHCTRQKGNVDIIQLQGLDERLGSGGTMGKGIYFASDPLKSMAYDGTGCTIFIFMVLLGDCLSINAKNIKNFVREPEKQPVQQRNYTDIHFDSIVGQPIIHSEYVVYNRYQCCPLYKISYKRQPIAAATNNIYSQSKNCLPPFCWTSSKTGVTPMPTPSTNSDWPFFAKTIFTQMGVEENRDMDVEMEPEVEILESAESIENKLAILTGLGFINAEMNLEILRQNSYNVDKTINNLLEVSDTTIDESEMLNNNKLATLSSLGFTNAELNAEILKKNSYDLNKCVSDLLERFEEGAGANIDNGSASEFPMKTLDAAGDSSNDAKREDCLICSDEFEVSATNWKVLQCGHKLCIQCCEQIETTGTTMAGVTHTFIKCPFCMKTFGVEIGNCPNGTMRTSIVSTPCQGYDRYQSICIQYVINCSPYQLNRAAYLPNNDEGNELLELLQIAWDRRICFTIGTSATNGQENVLVWNIHHKTAQAGGVESHGFPDDTYMKRCKLELRAHGIE